MIINKLKIQGFKSFSEKQVLDFGTVDVGLSLVTGNNDVEPELGANGVGKSALFNSLCFAFFGKTAENLKASDIANWNEKEKCEVVVEFEQKKTQYTLTRKWNPNSIELDAIHPEGFSTSKIVTQEDVEKVIGMNFDSFLYSVLISQFGKKFIDFTPSEKMEVFSEIMDDVLKKWDKYIEKAKELKDLKEKNISEHEKEVANLEGQIGSIDLESIKEHTDSWEEENKKRIERESEKLNNKSIKICESNIVYYKKSVEKASEKAEELKKDLVYAQTEHDTIEHNYKEARDKRVRQGALIETKNNTLLNAQNLSGGGKCPTCDKKLTKEYLDKYVVDLSKEILFMGTIYTDICEEEKELESKLLNAKNSMDKINKSLAEKYDEITKLNSLIQQDKLIINNTNKEIEEIKKNINEIKNAVNPYKSLYEESKDRLAVLKRQLLYKNESLQNEIKDFEIYKYWMKGFKDIKLLLTEEALKEFEIEINNNIIKLGLSSEWSVKLGISSENRTGTIRKGFSVLVSSPFNDSQVPFECWSGGEGQRIRIAITMGLVDFIRNRRGVRSNILVLDEPTQFLSEKGIEDLIDFLREKAKEDNLKIFLIDHRNLSTYGQFSNILTVTKDMDGSRVNLST